MRRSFARTEDWPLPSSPKTVIPPKLALAREEESPAVNVPPECCVVKVLAHTVRCFLAHPAGPEHMVRPEPDWKCIVKNCRENPVRIAPPAAW